jgi:hypothetical protein
MGRPSYLRQIAVPLPSGEPVLFPTRHAPSEEARPRAVAPAALGERVQAPPTPEAATREPMTAPRPIAPRDPAPADAAPPDTWGQRPEPVADPRAGSNATPDAVTATPEHVELRAAAPETHTVPHPEPAPATTEVEAEARAPLSAKPIRTRREKAEQALSRPARVTRLEPAEAAGRDAVYFSEEPELAMPPPRPHRFPAARETPQHLEPDPARGADGARLQDASPNRSDRAPPHIHIGTVEVKASALPPPSAPVQPAAPSPPAPPVSRGYGWRFGLLLG